MPLPLSLTGMVCMWGDRVAMCVCVGLLSFDLCARLQAVVQEVWE